MKDWWLEDGLDEKCKKNIDREKMFIRNSREDDYYWDIGSATALRIASEIGTPVSVGDILHGIRIGRIRFDPLKDNLFLLRRKEEGLTYTDMLKRQCESIKESIINKFGYLPGFLVEMEDETMKKQTTPYNLFYKPRTPKQLAMDQIQNVIFNDPATIVIWVDGTKTIVKADNEPFDPEKGLAMAISKKFFGNKGYYYDVFKKWLPREEESLNTTVESKCITVKEFAKMAGVSESTVRKRLEKGQIPSADKVNGKWMIPIMEEVHTRN